jgi:hypothetical protein
MNMTQRKMEIQLNLQPPLFLRTVEALNVLYLVTLSLLSLIFFQRVQAWPIIVVGNALVVALILVLARAAENHQQRNYRILRDWLPAPLILLTFKETYLMVHPIHPIDYDSLLIDLDRLLFGFDPTRWLAQFSHPVITEYLQIIYSTFYILPLLLGYELYRQQRSREFQYAFFVIVYGFYLSYIGYFLLPALGPRFTLHDFQSLDHDLPGIFFTKYIRLFINTGENIPARHFSEWTCGSNTDHHVSFYKIRAEISVVFLPCWHQPYNLNCLLTVSLCRRFNCRGVADGFRHHDSTGN